MSAARSLADAAAESRRIDEVVAVRNWRDEVDLRPRCCECNDLLPPPKNPRRPGRPRRMCRKLECKRSYERLWRAGWRKPLSWAPWKPIAQQLEFGIREITKMVLQKRCKP